jgi:hypothetical protein
MTVTNGTRDESVVRYDDRLPLRGRALLPAIAMGVGAGLVVFYLARLMGERTPIELEPREQAPNRDVAPTRTRG